MTPEVLQLLAKLQPSIAALPRIVLLSPSAQERELFPNARVLRVKDWDLNQPKPELRADLIVASHVFHYAPDAALWFRNVLASCRAFLFADLITRQRSAESEFGKDGDRMRFSIGEHKARVPDAFNLDTLGERLLGHQVFDGGRNEYGDALHVLGLVRGDLTQPLLRVDDYPTGVRPVERDLAPLHAVLDEFEARGLQYHLGIVPAITGRGMFSHLRKLKGLIPTQHGYDHKQPHFSALLERKGDPGNRRGTVGAFNEFAWQRYSTVQRKLAEGKQRLESELGKDVTAYIPPCNRCDRTTAKALAALGFRLCLSERPAAGAYLPTLRSDFYGRSAQLGPDATPEVVGLHATWEADLWSQGERAALPRLLDQVQGQMRQREALLHTLARDVGALRSA